MLYLDTAVERPHFHGFPILFDPVTGLSSRSSDDWFNFGASYLSHFLPAGAEFTVRC